MCLASYRYSFEYTYLYIRRRDRPKRLKGLGHTDLCGDLFFCFWRNKI